MECGTLLYHYHYHTICISTFILLKSSTIVHYYSDLTLPFCNTHTLMVLLAEPFVLLQYYQTLKNRLIWEELVRTQFSSVTRSDSDRSLVRLELVTLARGHAESV